MTIYMLEASASSQILRPCVVVRLRNVFDPDRIRQNLRAIQERIAAAAARSGRPKEAVLLVAVTKTVTPEAVRALWEAGVRDFGENRVQALLHKSAALPDLAIRWHMIGSLQTNKVSKLLAAGGLALIHSLDSPRLAEALNAAAAKQGGVIETLVEVNVSGEASKHGLPPEAVGDFLRAVGGLERLRVSGLMTMAPLSMETEAARPVFAGLRALKESLREGMPLNVRLEHLSMGMSSDFEVAIEEGADIVRIGTALFRDA